MKIAIIGAGPSGLTLGSILHRRNIDFVVYEADESSKSRSQGGCLDLHSDTGQLALKEANLYGKFKQLARAEGDFTKVLKYDGTVLRDENKSGVVSVDSVERPEIERELLREMLIESIPKENIVWGSKVLKVEKEEGGKVRVEFSNADTKLFDLVVGADGAWSKVRKLISDKMPHYSSITIVELWAFNAALGHQNLVTYTGQGSNYMFDKDRCVISQRGGDDSIRVYACLRVDEGWKDNGGINWKDDQNCREDLISKHFDDCGLNIKEAILECTDKLVVRPIYMLPIGFKWEHKQGVTLLGDSAHLMSPFAGEGVNLAMKDALELANAITGSNLSTLDSKIKSYERSLFKRAKWYTQDTWDSMQLCFGEGGSEKFVEMLEGGVMFFIKFGLEYVNRLFWSILGY